MTVLVTGGSGLVGSAIVRALLARGERVRALVRAGCNDANLHGLAVEPAIGNLRDPASLQAAMRGVRAVYHAAADYRLWSLNDRDLFETNVGGTRNILEAARKAGVERFVYTSSVCTLGAAVDGRPADEESPVAACDLVGAYKQSKFEAEAVAKDFAAKGFPVVIVNPSTPIGPGDIRPTPTGRMILEAVQGRMPAYVNTGLNFVHVDDVAQGHLLAHDHGRPGRTYILGGANLSLRSLLLLIASTIGRPPPRFSLPRQAIYPIAYAAEAFAHVSGKEPFVTVNGLRLAKKLMYFSSARAQAELGYSFRSVREAVRDAVAWFGATAQDPSAPQALRAPPLPSSQVALS